MSDSDKWYGKISIIITKLALDHILDFSKNYQNLLILYCKYLKIGFSWFIDLKLFFIA